MTDRPDPTPRTAGDILREMAERAKARLPAPKPPPDAPPPPPPRHDPEDK